MNEAPVVTTTPAPPRSTASQGPDWTPLDDDIPLEPPFATPFLPPPPRAFFLDESVTTDGLTTCDLCTWARQRGQKPDTGGWGSFESNAAKEVPAELGWVLTLIIVSLTSALIGAIVMIVVLHCRRLKSSEVNEPERGFSLHQSSAQQRPPISTPGDKEISTITPVNFPQLPHNISHANQRYTNNGVWSWLSRKSNNSPTQLNTPPTLPAENHYTHMEDGYNSVGEEALYAELDRESSVDGDPGNPAYQNSGYTDPEAPDAPSSSAPSSAYYSDLSTNAIVPAYEVVGLVTMPSWEERRPRLAAITESISSDYV